MGAAMTRQTFFLLATVVIPCAFGAFFAASAASSADAEPFDRIVLKDMTVIKASLVKETGDSLAYFELNDPEFVKHMVGRDQVFKWIRATPRQPESPPKATAPAPDSSRMEKQDRLPEKNVQPPAAVKDSAEEGIPVVDYQSVLLRSGAPQGAGAPQPAPVKADTALPMHSGDSGMAPPAPPIAAEYDSSDAVPAGLSKVRLDQPTKTEGVKIVPRSGMLAINITPSLGSLGLGIRSWSSKGFGFGIKAALLWGSASGFLVNAEIMNALNSKGRCRWYGFAGVGYNWMTITIDLPTMPSVSMDLSFANLVFGVGLEWRMGINRNHGVSFEIGFQAGKADYTMHMDGDGGYIKPMDITATYKLSPIYFGGSYAYYF
jgi:hypothetical protein